MKIRGHYFSTFFIYFTAIFMHFVLGEYELDKWWRIVSTKYPMYNETTILLQEMEKSFPNLVKLYSLGKSVQNRDLWVLQLSQNVTQEREILKPMVKIVGNIHGNEVVGRSLVLMLIVDILKKYKDNNPRILRLLETTDLHLAPSVNPDGFEMANEINCGEGDEGSEQVLTGRSNFNGIDINRDFPHQYSETKKENEKLFDGKRQAETEWLMKWILENPFVLSTGLHGGDLVANYPYDDVPSCIQEMPFYDGVGVPYYSHDNEFFVEISKDYARKHKTMSKSKSRCTIHGTEFINGTTNGAAWYTIRGGMQDFNYLFSNCLEITLELSCCKYPSASTLKEEWKNNEEATYSFLEFVHRGVKGIVEDEEGNPIPAASVSIEGNPRTVVTTARGEYWKLVVGGSYNLQVKHNGCEVNVPVEVSNTAVTHANITLSCPVPTEAPTQVPTVIPSQAPTPVPTLIPTEMSISETSS